MGNSSGLPTPSRRTFATALQAFAHSMPASLSASMPALAANAGSRGVGSPSQRPRWSRDYPPGGRAFKSERMFAKEAWATRAKPAWSSMAVKRLF